MSLFGVLCELYDLNESIAGKTDGEKPMLIPIYHTTVTAQITVTIDEDGCFLDAEAVPDEENEKRTLIPVTDKSASRTAGIEPHPLCDNLKYLAGDYNTYVNDKDCSENHRLYMEGLCAWAESPYSHPKVRAVYTYLSQNSIIKDLLKAEILEADESGMLREDKKLQNVFQAGAFVRFRMQSNTLFTAEALEDTSGAAHSECWRDRSLQQSYIAFCRSEEGEMGLSYLTGEITKLSYLQPKKIRNEGDGAKLISSNDEANFTFLGRFTSKEEAFAIGYEDSQKAHNALKWIIRQQGINCEGMYLVTWENNLCEMPKWQEGADVICEEAENLLGEEIFEEELEEGLESMAGITGQADALRLKKSIYGYKRKLEPSSKTYIVVLDAATKGRLSIQEFKDFTSSQYLKRIEDWHERCKWEHPKSGKEGRHKFHGMVGVKDAAELLFGIEKEGYFSLKGKEKLYKAFVRRWMPCILDGREIPLDIVSQAQHRASSPLSFNSRFLWERVLAFACSLIKQQRYKRYKEVWTMALEEKCNKRDYLYGRLLALADRVEYRTFDKDNGRETNAKRYMNAFSQHPYRTWKVLEEKLGPYWGQLKMPERLAYQALMDDIFELFALEAFEDDTPLSGLYLLGFHNQSHAFKMKKEEKENE